MATDKSIKESSDWEDSIYQIQAGDMLAGGENGLANLQAQQIANRTAWLKAHAGDESRIKNLENMMMELYEEEFGSDPTGEYSGLMVEMFNGNNSEIDSAWAVIISIADDGSYVDVYGGQSFTVGDICQIEDADGVEEVRIKSIDRMLDYDRVFFEKPVEKHGDEARLRRTTSFLPDGKQHVGNIEFGMVINAEHKTGKTVHPADIPHSLEGYEYENFHMEGEKLVMCAPSVFGVSLLQTGGGNGTWAHVDESGYVIGKVVHNEVKRKQVIEKPEEQKKDPDYKAYILPHYSIYQENGDFLGLVAYVYNKATGAGSKVVIDKNVLAADLVNEFPQIVKAKDSKSERKTNTEYWPADGKIHPGELLRAWNETMTRYYAKMDSSALNALLANDENKQAIIDAFKNHSAFGDNAEASVCSMALVECRGERNRRPARIIPFAYIVHNANITNFTVYYEVGTVTYQDRVTHNDVYKYKVDGTAESMDTDEIPVISTLK